MTERYAVTVTAGSLTSADEPTVRFPHRWTAGGVSVTAAFTGAHLLHLAAAGCVLNDVYREAAELGLAVQGVRVDASGDFDVKSWRSTGVEYTVQVDTAATADELANLLARVDAVAEIPRAIRAGAPVRRVAAEGRWLDYCLDKPGAWRDEPWEDDVVAKVGPAGTGKIFAFLGLHGVAPSIGLKCGNREEADLLLERYPAAASRMPYLGQHGWNSIQLDGTIPEDEVRELIDASYAMVVAKLPRSHRPA